MQVEHTLVFEKKYCQHFDYSTPPQEMYVEVLTSPRDEKEMSYSTDDKGNIILADKLSGEYAGRMVKTGKLIPVGTIIRKDFTPFPGASDSEVKRLVLESHRAVDTQTYYYIHLKFDSE